MPLCTNSNLNNSVSAARHRVALHARVQQHLISFYLREPLRQTRRLLRANHRHLARLHRLRNKPQCRGFIRRYAAGFDIPDRDAISELLRSDSRSRVIATFHFGDFVFGLNQFSLLAPASRRQFFLSLEAQPAVCYDNLRKAFGSGAATDNQQLLKSSASGTELSALLRQPGTDLYLFADLPPGHGELCEVTFLGRRALFPRGAASLAVLNRVPLLPVICLARDGGNQVLVSRQLEPGCCRRRSATARITAMTQALVNLLELCHGEFAQWRYLPLLPDFFIPLGQKERGLNTG